MLPRLLSSTLQLLLNDALLVGHFQELRRVSLRQLTTCLFRLPLFRVQNLFGFPQLSNLRLEVLQLVTEHDVLLTQP